MRWNFNNFYESFMKKGFWLVLSFFIESLNDSNLWDIGNKYNYIKMGTCTPKTLLNYQGNYQNRFN